MLGDIVRIKPRAVLTREIALDIYRYKMENGEAVASAVGRHACVLAGMYGVSEKTIRDVWTARTWSEETCILDPTRGMKSVNELTLPSGHRAGESSGRLKQAYSAGAISDPQPIDADPSDWTGQPRWAMPHACTPSPRSTRTTGNFKRRRRSDRAEYGQRCEEEEGQEEQHQEQHQQHGGGSIAASGFLDPFHHDWPHWGRSAPAARAPPPPPRTAAALRPHLTTTVTSPWGPPGRLGLM